MQKWKKIVLGAVAAVVGFAWLGLIVTIVLGVETVGKPAWIAIVTFAAVSTEIGVWITAAILGLSIFQARKRIWQWLTSRFRRSPTPPT